jgi:hypothetical protein
MLIEARPHECSDSQVPVRRRDKKGDRVLFHGNPAEVELVAFDPNEPEHAWHVQEFGGGVMILDPIVSGRTFIATDQLIDYEDLEFVSRAGT